MVFQEKIAPKTTTPSAPSYRRYQLNFKATCVLLLIMVILKLRVRSQLTDECPVEEVTIRDRHGHLIPTFDKDKEVGTSITVKVKGFSSSDSISFFLPGKFEFEKEYETAGSTNQTLISPEKPARKHGFKDLVCHFPNGSRGFWLLQNKPAGEVLLDDILDKQEYTDATKTPVWTDTCSKDHTATDAPLLCLQKFDDTLCIVWASRSSFDPVKKYFCEDASCCVNWKSKDCEFEKMAQRWTGRYCSADGEMFNWACEEARASDKDIYGILHSPDIKDCTGLKPFLELAKTPVASNKTELKPICNVKHRADCTMTYNHISIRITPGCEISDEMRGKTWTIHCRIYKTKDNMVYKAKDKKVLESEIRNVIIKLEAKTTTTTSSTSKSSMPKTASRIGRPSEIPTQPKKPQDQSPPTGPSGIPNATGPSKKSQATALTSTPHASTPESCSTGVCHGGWLVAILFLVGIAVGAIGMGGVCAAIFYKKQKKKNKGGKENQEKNEKEKSKESQQEEEKKEQEDEQEKEEAEKRQRLKNKKDLDMFQRAVMNCDSDPISFPTELYEHEELMDNSSSSTLKETKKEEDEKRAEKSGKEAKKKSEPEGTEAAKAEGDDGTAEEKGSSLNYVTHLALKLVDDIM